MKMAEMKKIEKERATREEREDETHKTRLLPGWK